MHPTHRFPLRALVLGFVLVAAAAGRATACPFCSAVSLTFAQEIAQSQAAVIARLVEPPTEGSLAPRADGPLPKARFAVVEVLKGADLVAEAGHDGPDGTLIETIMLERKPVGGLHLLMAVEPPKLVWSTPIAVSDRAVAYIKRLGTLPEKGPDRLAFFQQHLEDEDEVLARDAYDEFAVAPYEDVRGLESRMDPTQLLAWIENPRVAANRRRLYATMLGVCGTKADAARIGKILAGEGFTGDTAEVRSGLDALIACYVTLQGPEGLDLVDRLFLSRGEREVPFTETYAAVMALRFLGEESRDVPRERVLASLRRLLDEPKLADLVIADLARWQDWSVVGRLEELFTNANADNIFVREPVINYLKACPLPEAAAAVERLTAIDPEAVRRAATLAGFAGALAAKPAPAAAAAQGADGDPGDPSGATPPPPPASATGPATADDQALASRVAPVLADDDATDARASIDPATDPATAGDVTVPAVPVPAVSVPGAAAPTSPTSWLPRALLLGGLGILVAMIIRSAMRAGGGPT
jgi:hypothetical protein